MCGFCSLENDNHKATDRSDEVKRSFRCHQAGFLWPPVTQDTSRNELHKQAAVFESVSSVILFNKKFKILDCDCCPNSVLQTSHSGHVHTRMMTSSKWKFENKPQTVPTRKKGLSHSLASQGGITSNEATQQLQKPSFSSPLSATAADSSVQTGPPAATQSPRFYADQL